MKSPVFMFGPLFVVLCLWSTLVAGLYIKEVRYSDSLCTKPATYFYYKNATCVTSSIVSGFYAIGSDANTSIIIVGYYPTTTCNGNMEVYTSIHTGTCIPDPIATPGAFAIFSVVSSIDYSGYFPALFQQVFRSGHQNCDVSDSTTTLEHVVIFNPTACHYDTKFGRFGSYQTIACDETDIDYFTVAEYNTNTCNSTLLNTYTAEVSSCSSSSLYYPPPYTYRTYCAMDVKTLTSTITTSTTTTSAKATTTTTTTGGSVSGGVVVAGGGATSTTSIPVTGGYTNQQATSDAVTKDSSSGDASPMSTAAILAIVLPITAVLTVGLGMLFIHHQRSRAVQALIKAEEEARRTYTIDFNSLSVDWLVGSGSFGYVYRGEYRGADVAIKKLKKQNMAEQQLDDFAQEAMLMVSLRHPNIVLFMGVCLEKPELCIVTEYMPRGNLYDVLHDKSIKLPFNVIREMALHIVKGLQFIHSAGMIHRDLKSPNLLVDANWTIKIADFGLSCAKTQVTDDVQISLLWTAPEILMREKHCYSEKSDVYSLGIILWELMSRQTPFGEFNAPAIPSLVVLGKRPPLNHDWNATFKVLVAQCWGQIPSHRPFVREVRSALAGISTETGEGGPLPQSAKNSKSSKYHEPVFVPEPPPAPPHGHVTLVFTNVENATELWEADPNVMFGALKLLNTILRRKIKEYGGYESKHEGDCSMFAFGDPISAVNFCIATQEELLAAEWSDKLLQLPAAREESNSQRMLIYRGLRVQMGMHYGEPHIEQDQISYRTEYFGPVVSTAARITAHAVGGQVVMTSDVYSRIVKHQSKLEPCTLEQLGPIQAMGVSVVLYQVWPRDIKGRRYSKPVLDLTVPHPSSKEEVESLSHNFPHEEKWIIDYNDLELHVVIGTGSFGDVYAGTWKKQDVVIKQFMKQQISDDMLLEMRTESGILSSISHPNIIKFIGMCTKVPHLCIVTELLDRGNLQSILLGNEAISWERKKQFAKDIARGLEYLHKNNIVHRDVKSPNMLVAKDWTVKIGDFGFSRVKDENNTMTQCGTVAWTAPEIFIGDRYTEKADVYSYSVILWELVYRVKPWRGLSSMKVCSAVQNGERLSIASPTPGTPEYILRLIEACWLQDHEKRPSFTKVLEYLEQN